MLFPQEKFNVIIQVEVVQWLILRLGFVLKYLGKKLHKDCVLDKFNGAIFIFFRIKFHIENTVPLKPEIYSQLFLYQNLINTYFTNLIDIKGGFDPAKNRNQNSWIPNEMKYRSKGGRLLHICMT